MTHTVDMRHITRRFGVVTANDDVSLTAQPGEILGLIGGNGAGKSTLMHILSGLLSPDAGELLVDGHAVQFRNAADAAVLGIGMVHQELLLVEALSGLDNCILGREPGRRGVIDRRGARKELEQLAQQYGLRCPLTEPAARLSMGDRLRLEILKVLYGRARILILDEPTTVLTPDEVDTLFETLRSLRDGGATIIFISHKLQEIFSLCDRLTIMREGRIAGTFARADTDPDTVAELMVGETILLTPYLQEGSRTQRACLEIERLTVSGPDKALRLEDVSLTVESGEILGIAGVEGNGQFELETALTGYRKPDRGQIFVDRKDMSGRHPGAFRTAGVGWIPSERLQLAAVGPLSLTENFALGGLRLPEGGKQTLASFGRLHRDDLEHTSGALIREYGIRCNDPEAPFQSLSGGNQQRAVFARELSRPLKLLVAAHPTRGVDIKGAQFLHWRLRKAAGQGIAILLISSDLDELFELCNRIGVLYNGRLIRVLERTMTTTREIGRLMAGRTGGKESPA